MERNKSLGFVSRLSARDNIVFLICFLASALIWLTIKLSTERTYEFELPVKYSIEPSKIVFSDLPEHLRISVQGQIRDIMRLQNASRKDSFELDIIEGSNLSQATINQMLVDKTNAFNVTLISNHTGQIQVELDSIMTKTVPISNRATATANQGYIITSNSIRPDKINIIGPTSFVQYVDSVSTNTVSKKNLVKNTIDSLDLLQSVSKLIKLEPSKTKWELKVEKLVEKDITLNLEQIGVTQLDQDSIQIRYKSIANHTLDADKLIIQNDVNDPDMLELISNDKYIIIESYNLN